MLVMMVMVETMIFSSSKTTPDWNQLQFISPPNQIDAAGITAILSFAFLYLLCVIDKCKKYTAPPHQIDAVGSLLTSLKAHVLTMQMLLNHVDCTYLCRYSLQPTIWSNAQSCCDRASITTARCRPYHVFVCAFVLYLYLYLICICICICAQSCCDRASITTARCWPSPCNLTSRAALHLTKGTTCVQWNAENGTLISYKHCTAASWHERREKHVKCTVQLHIIECIEFFSQRCTAVQTFILLHWESDNSWAVHIELLLHWHELIWDQNMGALHFTMCVALHTAHCTLQWADMSWSWITLHTTHSTLHDALSCCTDMSWSWIKTWGEDKKQGPGAATVH